MSNQPAKRQRANTNRDSQSSRTEGEYKEIVKTFDERTVRDLLVKAATSSGQVGEQIIACREAILNAERTKTIDFDYLSKRVWHELQTGNRQRGSRQYELGLEASVAVEETIEDIQKRTPAHSSFGTKQSALETLRKIGKSLVFRISDIDSFSHEVHKSLQNHGDPQESVMLEIVKEMTAEEKAKMLDNTEWLAKVEELVEIGSNHSMYQGLNEMLDDLGWVEDEGE